MDQEGFYLGLGYTPWGRGAKFGTRFEGMLGALATQLSATPIALADARPAVDWSIVSHLGVRFWFGSTILRGTAGLALLYGLRPVLATDSGVPTTSNEGLGTEASVGLSLRL